MFCKNCGREIDADTLERLIRKKGDTVLCKNCGRPLDTAEFCGGFWGLAASDAEKQGRGDGEIPGVTEADRLWAKMILADQTAGQNKTAGGRTGAGGSGPTDDSYSGRTGGARSGGSGNVRTGGSSGNGGIRSPRALTALLMAAALLVGLVAGRFIPFGRGGAGGSQTAGSQEAQGLAGDAAAQEDSGGDELDALIDGRTGEEATVAEEDPEEDSLTTGLPGGTVGAEETTASNYNTIKRNLRVLGDISVEESLFYVNARDTGIIFADEAMRDDDPATAGGIAYIRTETETSGGRLEKLTRFFCDENGLETNTGAGYSRIVCLYDENGRLTGREYYSVRDDQEDQAVQEYLDSADSRDKGTDTEKDAQKDGAENGEREAVLIYTADCSVVGSEEGETAQEIYHLEAGQETNAPRYLRIERTFMGEDSAFPGALSTVRYYLGENDTMAAREEEHTYEKSDSMPKGEGLEDEGYAYYVEESIRVQDRTGTIAETEETFGEDSRGPQTVRYFFEGDEGQERLAEMQYCNNDGDVTGNAGFAWFYRTYNEDGTEIEDSFFISPDMENDEAGEESTDQETSQETEKTDRKSAEDQPAAMTSAEPLLEEEFLPGIYSVEYPYLFRMP